MTNLLATVKGYKTYAVCALMIVYVLAGYALGKGFDTSLLLQALAVAGLRNGIGN